MFLGELFYSSKGSVQDSFVHIRYFVVRLYTVVVYCLCFIYELCYRGLSDETYLHDEGHIGGESVWKWISLSASICGYSDYCLSSCWRVKVTIRNSTDFESLIIQIA